MAKEVLGIITARGGSKSIPGKNLVDLNGKPLLAYTCEAALASSGLTRVILSTDDEAIAECGRQCGVEVPFMRPTELAEDETSSMAVIHHVVTELKEKEGYQPDACVILQPTTPLRTAKHIDEGIALLEGDVDSVLGVEEIQHMAAPPMAMRFEGDQLVPFMQASFDRRQDAEMFYRINGALYILRTDLVLQPVDRPYGSNCRAVVMDKYSSLDIDEPFDVQLISTILQARS